MKYILALLAVSFNANAGCVVVGGYVQCYENPPPVFVPPTIIIPPQAPYIPAPLPSTGEIVRK